MRSLVAAVTISLMLIGPAAAAIRILDSVYADNTLIVTGQTRPGQQISLDGKFTTKADSGGHFEFRVKYKPPTCMSNITAGEDSYSAVITNCLLGDATALDHAAAAGNDR
jgi:hypothetical protein